MKLNYNFCQDKEPTDKQLEMLMREVAFDARKIKSRSCLSKINSQRSQVGSQKI